MVSIGINAELGAVGPLDELGEVIAGVVLSDPTVVSVPTSDLDLLSAEGLDILRITVIRLGISRASVSSVEDAAGLTNPGGVAGPGTLSPSIDVVLSICSSSRVKDSMSPVRCGAAGSLQASVGGLPSLATSTALSVIPFSPYLSQNSFKAAA